MKKFHLISAIISILMIASVYFVSGQMKALKSPNKKKTPEIPKVLVDVIEVQPELVTMTVNSQGTVEPKIKSNLVSEVSGKIVKVSDKFVNGGFFNKGDTLLVIESDNYQAEVMSAEARMAQSEALYRQEKARSAQARKDWQKIGKGQANDLVLRLPQLQQAEADMKSAQATLKRAKRNLSKTRIIADFDGIIRSKSVDLGQFVSMGTRVAEVWGTATAEIRLPITDSELSYLTLPSPRTDGFKPRVIFQQQSSGMAQEWFGEILRTEGVIDLKNRVTYLVAEINDPYQLDAKEAKAPLFFGSFVTASIQGKEYDNVYALPKQAIDQQQRVQLLTNESVMRITPVEVARITQDKIYVTSGLQPGDLVITTALDEVLNGSKVARTGITDVPEDENVIKEAAEVSNETTEDKVTAQKLAEQ